MLRGIFAAVAGVVVAGLIVFAVEWVGHQVYPLPAGMNANDAAALAAYVQTAPMGALLFVIAAWVAGTFTGTALASAIGGAIPGSVAGAINTGFAVLTVIMVPQHPLWFIIAGLGLTIVAAVVAVRTFARR